MAAVFTIDSASKPKLILKSAFSFRQNQNTSQILNIQITGDRIIRLEKP